MTSTPPSSVMRTVQPWALRIFVVILVRVVFFRVDRTCVHVVAANAPQRTPGHLVDQEKPPPIRMMAGHHARGARRLGVRSSIHVELTIGKQGHDAIVEG